VVVVVMHAPFIADPEATNLRSQAGRSHARTWPGLVKAV
jgi:hypothetical protein